MAKRPKTPEIWSCPSKRPKQLCHSDVVEQINTFMSSEKAAAVSDITLFSAEGVKIPAIRALLVIRSSYFEKMLTDDIPRSWSNILNVPIRATALHHVLEYIYTGSCALIRKFLACYRCDWAVEVIELASAADRLGIKKLLDWCIDSLTEVIEDSWHVLCCLLEKLVNNRSKWVDDSGILEKLLDTIGPCMTIGESDDASSCKLRHGVMHLGDTAVRTLFEKVFKDSEGAGEYSSCLFQALMIWVSYDTLPLMNVEDYDYEESQLLVKVDKTRFLDDRMETAKFLARKFDLARMTPIIVNEVVQKSGLVETHVINEAYRKLALRFEERERRALDERDKLQVQIYKLDGRKLGATRERAVPF